MTEKKKKTSKKPRKRKSRKKQTLSYRARMSIAVLGLVIFIGLSLLSLSLLRQNISSEPPEILAEIVSFEEVKEIFEDDLLDSNSSAGWQRLPATEDITLLNMFGEYPDEYRLMELATRIALTDSPAQLDLAPRKGFVRLYWEGQLKIELRYQVPEEIRTKRPVIAVIMDDMGRSLKTFEKLLRLGLQVTPAILPETTYASRATELLQSAGREYMIHLPMQPKNYPAINPGPNALLLDLTEGEIRSRVRGYFEKVPGAVGGNNHMGSGFTRQRNPMRVVLEELQAQGKFFIDSKTIGDSIAFDQARRMGIRTGSRHIFLDNKEDLGYIRKQIRRMVNIAEEKGEVIAICHPYPETLEAFRREMEWLQDQPVDFVAASVVARRR